MSMSTRRQRRDSRGASAVEAALVITIFLTLVFGIVEFGRAVWLHQAVSAAAREGARYGISNQLEGTVPRYLHCEGIKDAARGRTPDLNNPVIKVKYRAPGASDADLKDCDVPAEYGPLATSLVNQTRIEVTVSIPFDLNLPLVPLDAFTISATDSRSIYNGKDSP
jgi:hypothetical protein